MGRGVGWECWGQGTIKRRLFLRFMDPGLLFFFPHFLIVLNVHSTEYVLFFFFLRSIEQNYLLEDSCFTKNCVSLCHTHHKLAIGIHMSPFS